MIYDDKSRETEDVQVQDIQVEAALRHFRESMRGWSEAEFGKARTIRRSRWDAMARMIVRPAVGWAMAGALLVASAGVPVAVHHERELAAERKLVQERQQELEARATEQKPATAMNDDELMSHVDSDIAQGAPDAMEPLVSLMSDTTVSK
jgi:hypothetical protein